MFVVTVTFEVMPDKAKDFHKAVLKQAENSLKLEERCRRFDVCVDNEHNHRVFLYEIYDDAAAFQTHLQSDHFKAFDAVVRPWLLNKTIENWSLASDARWALPRA
jgi:quinol monooxygenase YgiN